MKLLKGYDLLSSFFTQENGTLREAPCLKREKCVFESLKGR